MNNKYCCCVIVKNVKGNILYEGCQHVLDTVTFPNPNNDPLALEACRVRAEVLQAAGVNAKAAVIETD